MKESLRKTNGKRGKKSTSDYMLSKSGNLIKKKGKIYGDDHARERKSGRREEREGSGRKKGRDGSRRNYGGSSIGTSEKEREGTERSIREDKNFERKKRSHKQERTVDDDATEGSRTDVRRKRKGKNDKESRTSARKKGVDKNADESDTDVMRKGSRKKQDKKKGESTDDNETDGSRTDVRKKGKGKKVPEKKSQRSGKSESEDESDENKSKKQGRKKALRGKMGYDDENEDDIVSKRKKKGKSRSVSGASSSRGGRKTEAQSRKPVGSATEGRNRSRGEESRGRSRSRMGSEERRKGPSNYRSSSMGRADDIPTKIFDIAGIKRTGERLPKEYLYFLEKFTKLFPDFDLSALILPYACFADGQLYYRFNEKKPIFVETYSNV